MVTKLNCPIYDCEINVNDWFDKYAKSDGLYYFTCKCKIKLGSTLMMDGKIAIWEKSTEIK